MYGTYAQRLHDRRLGALQRFPRSINVHPPKKGRVRRTEEQRQAEYARLVELTSRPGLKRK